MAKIATQSEAHYWPDKARLHINAIKK